MLEWSTDLCMPSMGNLGHNSKEWDFYTVLWNLIYSIRISECKAPVLIICIAWKTPWPVTWQYCNTVPRVSMLIQRGIQPRPITSPYSWCESLHVQRCFILEVWYRTFPYQWSIRRLHAQNMEYYCNTTVHENSSLRFVMHFRLHNTDT